MNIYFGDGQHVFFSLAVIQNMMSDLEKTVISTSCLACEVELSSVLCLMYHMLAADCLSCREEKLSVLGETSGNHQQQTSYIIS